MAHVNDYLLGLLGWSDPDLDGRGLSYASAVERVASEIDVRFANDPDLAASLHARVGTTLHRLGSDASARSHLERAREAVSRGRIVAPRIQASIDLALSEIEYDGGDFEAAEVNAERALANADDDLGRRRNQIALVWLELDRADEAQEVLEELVERRGVSGRRPASLTRIPRQLALAEHRNGESRSGARRSGARWIWRASRWATSIRSSLHLLEVRSDIAQSSGPTPTHSRISSTCSQSEHTLGPDHLDVALTLDMLWRASGIVAPPARRRAFLDRAGRSWRHRGGPDDAWQIELPDLELQDPACSLRGSERGGGRRDLQRRVLDGYRARLGDHEIRAERRRSLGRLARPRLLRAKRRPSSKAVMEATRVKVAPIAGRAATCGTKLGSGFQAR